MEGFEEKSLYSGNVWLHGFHMKEGQYFFETPELLPAPPSNICFKLYKKQKKGK